jgi:flagellar biosynthetic protein FlhB
MADQSGKSEKATQQRLQKARREGRFATSKDFVGALQFVTFVFLLTGATGNWVAVTKRLIRVLMEQALHQELGLKELVGMAHLLMDQLIAPFLVRGFILTGVSLAVHLAITRFGFSFKRLTPDPQRFNSIKRIREMPRQGLWAVMQALVMLGVFGALLYGIARDNVQLFMFLPLARPEVGVHQVAGSLMSLLWKAAGLFVVFGTVDLFRQVNRFQQEMRMSKQEVKEEAKESQGNPLIKMRIRRIQRDVRRRRMMHEVATATAVVVNPTHYAVALRYQHEEMATPVVVAKGKNYLALRIRQRALENQVPLVENPPLAQALYRSVEVGQAIPPHLYRAVAEILAYIYKLMDHRRARR